MAEREFVPIGIAILTVSDTRTLEEDTSGALIAERIASMGHRIVHRGLVKDDEDTIRTTVGRFVEDARIDVVITTGGTGVTARDVTPEAFAHVYDKVIPGFGELFRWLSYAKIGTSTIQSRATAGVAGGTYLFALPGSPGACKDAWDGILESQLDSRHRPCNFVELMPRLVAD